MHGRARDLFTGDDVSHPTVLAEEDLFARWSPDRRLESLRGSEPALSGISGVQAGGELRKALTAAIPEQVDGASLLNRLLEDVSTASFVTTHAWSAWAPDWIERYQRAGLASRIERDVSGVCTGFRPGSSALREGGRSRIDIQTRYFAPPPFRDDDPHAWHRFDPDIGPNQRRIRCIDLWRDDGLLRVEASFQDSAALPDGSGQRRIYHEYRFDAEIDAADDVLKAITVRPAVLPYVECIDASVGARRMIGVSVAAFRRQVGSALPGILGCTHLNDMLRVLQDVPAMRAALDRALHP